MKTVTLVLKSKRCEERLEIDASLWANFEKKARELEIPVEQLFVLVIKETTAHPEKIAEFLRVQSD